MGLREGVRPILILDTNFIMYIADGSIPLSMLYEALPYSMQLAIVGSTIDELKRLSTTAPRLSDRKKARRALDILGRIKAAILDSPTGSVDDDIVMAALALKSEGRRVIVATGDRELRRRLRSHGIPTLYPRGPEMMPRVDWEPL